MPGGSLPLHPPGLVESERDIGFRNQNSGRDRNECHPFWIVAETITLLCHMTDPWPREVIGQQACLILRQRVQYSHPTFRRLLGIGIVHELGQRLLQQYDRMMSKVADIAK